MEKKYKEDVLKTLLEKKVVLMRPKLEVDELIKITRRKFHQD